MIEREVTDLIGISFGALLISIIFSQEDYQFSDFPLSVIGLLIVILTGFVHIIFYQLHYISEQGSTMFSIANSVGLLLTIIGMMVYDVKDTQGFWRDIPNGFSLILLLGIGSIAAANLLSFKAKLAPR